MKMERAKRKASDVRNIETNGMATHSPDRKASEIFHRPPYAAGNMNQGGALHGKQTDRN